MLQAVHELRAGSQSVYLDEKVEEVVFKKHGDIIPHPFPLWVTIVLDSSLHSPLDTSQLASRVGTARKFDSEGSFVPLGGT